jgi:hypothetical protein
MVTTSVTKPALFGQAKLRHKLRNVIFHEFLDGIRHLREAFVAPLIIPFNDFYPLPLFRLSSYPCSDLLVRSTRGDEVLEFVGTSFAFPISRAVTFLINDRLRSGSVIGPDDHVWWLIVARKP